MLLTMPMESRSKSNLAVTLRRAWYHLRPSVRDPTRVPTWDFIILTASSPEQAELFNWQLARAKRIGRIAPFSVTLAVPEPLGQHIGSGAATLNSIHALANHAGCSSRLGMFSLVLMLSALFFPNDTASIVTVPITLDIASNHGVIVASKSGSPNDNNSVALVKNLLQKPTIEELVENQAMLSDGRTLLDTGIIAVKG